jgi:hypothetical protein
VSYVDILNLNDPADEVIHAAHLRVKRADMAQFFIITVCKMYVVWFELQFEMMA